MLWHILSTPPKWIVDKFDQEVRMTFGFWTLVISLIALPFFGRYVMFVSILSILALVPNFTSETPVKVEDEDG